MEDEKKDFRKVKAINIYKIRGKEWQIRKKEKERNGMWAKKIRKRNSRYDAKIT